MALKPNILILTLNLFCVCFVFHVKFLFFSHLLNLKKKRLPLCSPTKAEKLKLINMELSFMAKQYSTL